MRVATGKVITGKVVIEGAPFADGANVTVIAAAQRAIRFARAAREIAQAFSGGGKGRCLAGARPESGFNSRRSQRQNQLSDCLVSDRQLRWAVLPDIQGVEFRYGAEVKILRTHRTNYNLPRSQLEKAYQVVAID